MTFHNLWIQARSGRSSSRKGPVGGADLFTFATSTVNTRMVPRGGEGRRKHKSQGAVSRPKLPRQLVGRYLTECGGDCGMSRYQPVTSG